MIKNNFIKLIIFLFLSICNLYTYSYSEIIILGKCNSKKDSFLKNEYILDLDRSLMIRNYIYDKKTFKKYHSTDLSIKKKNTIERFIYEDNGLILTDKIGYPQFYTQLIFEKKKKDIKIKTVINNEVATSKISTCEKIEVFLDKS